MLTGSTGVDELTKPIAKTGKEKDSRGSVPKPDNKLVLKYPFEPNSRLKLLGGSLSDEWNNYLSNLVVSALPITASGVTKQTMAAAKAVSYCTMDMKPDDPVEGILIAQLMAANEAALTLYRKGWRNVNVPEYFEGGTKFLQLADKAARTVVLLTERLDHHRGRGQQQIVVKHVTVNADKAMVADSITTGTPPAVPLEHKTPVGIDQIIEPELVEGGRGKKPK